MTSRTLALLAAATLAAGAFALPVFAKAPKGQDGAPAAECAEAPRARQGHGKRQGHFGHPPNPEHKALFPFWENERVSKELGLTSEQTAALAESHELLRGQLESSQDSIKAAREALRAEMEKDNPDLQTVYKLSDAVAEAQNARKRLVLGHAVTVKNVLTAEQEQTLRDNAPGHARRRMGELSQMREEIRESLRSGGNREDVRAILSEHDVKGPMRDRLMDRLERRASRRPAAPPAPPAPPAAEADWDADPLMPE